MLSNRCVTKANRNSYAGVVLKMGVYKGHQNCRVLKEKK